MAEIKWIKICTDLFDDEKIMLIESLPKGDTILLIWIKLLCLAGKQNNSGVFQINGKIAYNDEMFSKIFRKNINTIRIALKTFERFGMIEMIENVVTIPNWEKHQNIDKLSGIREYNRLAQQKSRAKKKQLAEQTINDMSMTSQPSHDTDKEDKDKDKDIYINIYIEIVNYLNEKAKTKYKPSTAKTKSHIKARLDEGFTLEDFKTVIDKKCVEWVGTEFEQYLRPETLFGTKFESYLNAKVKTKADSIDSSKNDLDDLF